MRWVFIGLGVLGLVFVLMMVFAPGDGGKDHQAPGWIRGLGTALSGLAPHVEAFADGTNRLEVGSDGQTSAQIKPDRKRDNRLVELRLVAGGPVRLVFRCARAQGSDCEGDDQTLCLGALHHSDCSEQDEASAEGSFAIGKGGGTLTLIDDSGNGARVEIAE